MSSIPQEVSERLATASRQLRVTSLQREAQSQAFHAGELPQADVVAIKARCMIGKQSALRRLQAAIDQCDLVTAEAELQAVLSYSARIKGCDEALTSHALAA
jgi:hypothetical protein